MKYMFYSRKNGWPNGTIINFYTTEKINDIHNHSSDFVDKSGGEICKLIEKNYSDWKNDSLINQIYKAAKIWKQWYYYPANTIITDRTIYS